MGIVSEVQDEAELQALAYHLQGDAELNTLEAFEERQKLRKSPAVVKSLSSWWETSIETVRQARPDACDLPRPHLRVRWVHP